MSSTRLNAGDLANRWRRRSISTAFQPAPGGILITDAEGEPVLSQVIASTSSGSGRLASATVCFLVDLPPGARRARYYALLGETEAPSTDDAGIRQLPPKLGDGVRRLDTGTYEIELCRGTGGGDGGSKWGIRHFEHKDQRINLIHGNKNAFGGVYGPFFTPENGLVNPPAHMVIDVEPIVEGPVLCRYRMRGVVPDGLLPELRGKTIEIWWSFYHRSHWFVRTYFVDDYETTIDGRPVQQPHHGRRRDRERQEQSAPLHLPPPRRHALPRRRPLCGDPARAPARPPGAQPRGRQRRDGETRHRSGRGPGELALGQLLADVLRHRRRTCRRTSLPPRSSASGARRTGSSGPIATTT